mmetsp:Transcript_32091/g.42568  ORF Transcript_32091/g.42568 Transcript_32091/m.42568 type:complete len:113 (-) Transcript_32091:164-502(-)
MSDHEKSTESSEIGEMPALTMSQAKALCDDGLKRPVPVYNNHMESVVSNHDKEHRQYENDKEMEKQTKKGRDQQAKEVSSSGPIVQNKAMNRKPNNLVQQPGKMNRDMQRQF